MVRSLCIGDNIALYCESTLGFAYSCNTSSVANGLYVYHKQSKKCPENLVDPQLITFEVCIQNRFKLTKKYRNLYGNVNLENVDMEIRLHEQQAKTAAEAEIKDNAAEQKRNNGKEVRYGDILQLRHTYTDKYVHVNSRQTSKTDKNNILTALESFNDKSAQFRIIPRFKVKSEGDIVQYGDQITFESVKSSGHFFHSSKQLMPMDGSLSSELNLGVDQTAYTVVFLHSFVDSSELFVRGTQFVQLFHRELEAFLVAEGSPMQGVTEEVHLRIREVDNLNPRSLRAPTSAITYWQIENEDSIYSGDPLTWETQVRFRHVTTRKYLSVGEDNTIGLVDNHNDPRTVFKVHPITPESEMIELDTYVRLEHVMSSQWLQALNHEVYERRQLQCAEGESSMKSLKWDGADLRQVPRNCSTVLFISVSTDQQYDDAFSIQLVLPTAIKEFNYVAGLIPYLKHLMDDAVKGRYTSSKRAYNVCHCMSELREFLFVDGKPKKSRQKLLRNLQVLDLIVRYIELESCQSGEDVGHTHPVLKECYGIIHSYMMGNSRKNCLYFAKYIDIFFPQIMLQNELGFKAVQIIVELIRGNRKIVDRITTTQIDQFLNLIRRKQNHNYLELLHVLCVCNNVAITENQNFIAKRWLIEDQQGMYLTEVGQNINKTPNIIYVTTDQARTWVPMKEFFNTRSMNYSEDMALFMHKQLRLFYSLCYGRNVFVIEIITKRMGFISWDEAFLGICTEDLQPGVKAKYCQLIEGLFFDSGSNYSVIESPKLCFQYETLMGLPCDIKLVDDAMKTGQEMAEQFLSLRDWLTGFLEANHVLIATNIQHNYFVRQVLLLLNQLVRFGYYSQVEQLQNMFVSLISILDGSTDIPCPPDKGDGFTREKKKLVHRFRNTERYKESVENTSIMEAKYAAIEVLKAALAFESKVRLENFIRKFKECNIGQPLCKPRKKAFRKLHLQKALDETFDAYGRRSYDVIDQKRMIKELRNTFEEIAFIKRDKITSILVDLASYDYDNMTQQALSVLNSMFMSKETMFQQALDSLIIFDTESMAVHAMVSRIIPQMTLILRSKWTDEQVNDMESNFMRLAELCYLSHNPNSPHPVNQKILISMNVLEIIFRTLAVETDIQLKGENEGVKRVLRSALILLKAITHQYEDTQLKVFERIDEVLNVDLVDSELAKALMEVFVDNMNSCLKVQPRHIQKIMSHVATSQMEAPELLVLLNVIVKVKNANIPLKRNQMLVMKYFMQFFSKVAYFYDEPIDTRIEILRGDMGAQHQIYFIQLMNLLSVCNEGDNRYIESLSQSIISEEDIIKVVVNRDLHLYVISPFLKFFNGVYLTRDITDDDEVLPTDSSALVDASTEESRQVNIDDMRNLWTFLSRVSDEYEFLTDTCRDINGIRLVHDQIHKPMDIPLVFDPTDVTHRVFSIVKFTFESFCEFIQLFFVQNFAETISFEPEKEQAIVVRLATSFSNAMKRVVSLVSSTDKLKPILEAVTVLQTRSGLPVSVVEDVTREISAQSRFDSDCGDDIFNEFSRTEIDLNLKLKVFTVNCSLLNGGHNTVKAQLKHVSNREYTEIGGIDPLPLGEEFQSHISCFVRSGQHSTEAKYKYCSLLVKQLWISANINYMSGTVFGTTDVRNDQEKLDIRCLQILRAIIHNEERKLPEDWPYKTTEPLVKSGTKTIEKIQTVFSTFEISRKVLPHLASTKQQICKEVLSLQAMLLFNANRTVQTEMIEYFWSTREEVFFFAVRNSLQLSAGFIKEHKLFKEQQAMQKKLPKSKARNHVAFSDEASVATGISAHALKQIQLIESIDRMTNNPASTLTRSVNLAKIQSRTINRSKILNGHLQAHDDDETKATCSEDDIKVDIVGGNHQAHAMDNETLLEMKRACEDGQLNNYPHSVTSHRAEEEEEDVDVNDNYVELVLRVLAAVCDGQNKRLQDYLRIQPDNVKTFNLVFEVTQFLSVIYSNINENNVDLAIEVFSTINEFAVGNSENRMTVYDAKIMDFINFILRCGTLQEIPMLKMIDLWQTLATLLLSLIEENDPDSLGMIAEIKETLDKEAIFSIMAQVYRIHMPTDEPITPWGKLRLFCKTLVPQKEKVFGDATLKEASEELGFAWYRVLARLYDVDPKLGSKRIIISPEQLRAFRYYKKNCMSVELIKDNVIQKFNFRVRNKQVLREEVKEKVKWNVDRTSPSNKLRDFMDWSRVIMDDALYQRKCLKMPLLRFLTGGWMMWNNVVLVISFIISILMLIGKTVPNGHAITLADPLNTTVSVDVYLDPSAIWLPQYSYFNEIIYILGFIHNVFSTLIFVTFFISNHPSLPPVGSMIKGLFTKKKSSGDGEMDDGVKSNKVVSASLISMVTLYNLMAVVFSFMGSFYNQYFFAFHLLNIVQDNPTLQGVIRAVTQNGISLLWVAVLGIIILFYFAIIGFTFFQSGMATDNLMFCDTLARCFFTTIRFGIVADLLEKAVPNAAELSFTRFSEFAVYQLTFYILITIIGLNLIFGIIVDTFSELRDLKWQAEADMRDNCFICSRANFEFEHSGKGFAHHVAEEHNMWAYIFFFIHLQGTKSNDYTSIELYVSNLLKNDCYDFFPFNRSLCLAAKPEDVGESKFGKLLEDIKQLHIRQHQEANEKRRFEEMERQRRWRGKFSQDSRSGSLDQVDHSETTTSMSLQSGHEPEGWHPRNETERDWRPPLVPQISQRSVSPPRPLSPPDQDPHDPSPPSSNAEESNRSESPVFASYDLAGRPDNYPSDDPMQFLDEYDDDSCPRYTHF